MKRAMTLLALISLTAPFAAASDLRHLRFASTPSQSAVAVAPERASVAITPYALTGRKAESGMTAPASPAKNTWVVGNPHFRPGK